MKYGHLLKPRDAGNVGDWVRENLLENYYCWLDYSCCDRGHSLDAIFLRNLFLAALILRSSPVIALTTLCCYYVYLPVFPSTTSQVRVRVQS